MKKFLCSLLSFVFVFSIISSGSIFAEDTKKSSIQLNGVGVIIQNSTLLPAAALMKELGGQLSVDKDKITLAYQNNTVITELNSKYGKINGVGAQFNGASKNINGKLMIPLDLFKQSFHLNVTAEYGSLVTSKYLKSVTIHTESKNIVVLINDIYETYQKYIGKQVWILTPQILIRDLSGQLISFSEVKNLAQVTITNVKREDLLGNYLYVYFVHKGKTYIANFKDYWFNSVFLVNDPFKQYKFSQNHWNQIKERKISVGMTSDMVYLSWGSYDRHYKDTYSWGTSDMWVYEHYYSNDTYLYFHNNVLTSISN